MITVRFWDGADGSINLRMHGHAGAGRKGRDLICAGASTLALALAEGMKFCQEEEMLARPAQVQLEEGLAEITVLPKQEWAIAVWSMSLTVRLGLQRLAKAYPQYVQMKGGDDDE